MLTHTIAITPTQEEGIHSGRPRYRVICHTCQLILHRGTTGPNVWVRQHMDGESCAYAEPLVESEETGGPS